MTILLLDHYFKIKGWIYMGILEVLVKNLLNLISFSLIPPNFGGIKIWEFWLFGENIEEWVFPSTHFILSIKTFKQGNKRVTKIYLEKSQG